MYSTAMLTSEQAEQLRGGLERMARVVGAYAQRVGPILGEFARKVHAAMWQAYRNAGMPYGESEEGLMRWAREASEANRLRDEAERIESMHATCALLRRSAAKRAGG